MLEWQQEWIQGIREGNAMPLVSVPAVYDGRTITLLEAPPSREPYRVLVTFVEPADEADARASASARLRACVRRMAGRPAG